MAQGVPGPQAEQPVRLWDSPWVVAAAGGAFAIAIALTYWSVPPVGPTVRGPLVILIVLAAETFIYWLPVSFLAGTCGRARRVGYAAAISAGRALLCSGVFAFGDWLGLYRAYGAGPTTQGDGELLTAILTGIWAEYLVIPAAQVAWIALVLWCAVWYAVRGRGLPHWGRLAIPVNELGPTAPADLGGDCIAPLGAPVARTGRRRWSVGRLMMLLIGFACLVFVAGHRMTHCCIGCAVLRDDPRGVEWFVNRGADPIWGGGRHETLLDTAVKLDCAQAARALLQYIGDVDADAPAGVTVLHHAAAYGSTRMEQLFLEHGTNVNARADCGSTPLHFASLRGRTDSAELLVAHGADVNAKDNDGNTPLHTAAEGGWAEMALLLVEHGADASAANEAGDTALSCALQGERTAVVEVLREHGAEG